MECCPLRAQVRGRVVARNRLHGRLVAKRDRLWPPGRRRVRADPGRSSLVAAVRLAWRTIDQIWRNNRLPTPGWRNIEGTIRLAASRPAPDLLAGRGEHGGQNASCYPLTLAGRETDGWWPTDLRSGGTGRAAELQCPASRPITRTRRGPATGRRRTSALASRGPARSWLSHARLCPAPNTRPPDVHQHRSVACGPRADGPSRTRIRSHPRLAADLLHPRSCRRRRRSAVLSARNTSKPPETGW